MKITGNSGGSKAEIPRKGEAGWKTPTDAQCDTADFIAQGVV
jgi:hypothetical protein